LAVKCVDAINYVVKVYAELVHEMRNM